MQLSHTLQETYKIDITQLGCAVKILRAHVQLIAFKCIALGACSLTKPVDVAKIVARIPSRLLGFVIA